MLSFETARAKVIEVVGARSGDPKSKLRTTEAIDLASDPSSALGRVLATDIIADRN